MNKDISPKPVRPTVMTDFVESTFRARVTKRVGTITAEEFLGITRVFATRCAEVLPGNCVLDLNTESTNIIALLGQLVEARTEEGSLRALSEILNPKIEKVDLPKTTSRQIEEAFGKADSLQLAIRPAVRTGDVGDAFAAATLEKWIKPKTIELYAQHASRLGEPNTLVEHLRENFALAHFGLNFRITVGILK